ncbi:BON domain-containing protein [Planctomicrobium sp. SH661]|uniref:BON domain-containing protein n=1 Tax=Planctomicrobium sp. SH661 TaxID=3448124 RepID=UPI003F5B1D72
MAGEADVVRILLSLTVVAGLFQTSVASAQSLFGSSGALANTASSNAGGGNRTSGSGMFASGSGGGSSLGGGGGAFGGSGGGMSGGSSSGGSGMLGGTSTLTQSNLNAGDGSLGATIGTSGFVGRGDTAGRFVGSQNASQQRINSAAQQFSQFQNRNSQNANTNTNTPRTLMRPQVQLGFVPPSDLNDNLVATLQTRLEGLPALGSRADGVSMTADSNGLVTLTGTVANEDDRRMMEILTRLEPGVRNVQNDLKVTP